MSDFVTQLKLAEKAREDIYFEKLNNELIEALHRRAKQEKAATESAASAGTAPDKHD
jgi:hypothetical protein